MSNYSANFERWWKTYPAHRRREKPKCFEVWEKQGLEARANDVIKKLEADVSFDPAWQRDGQGKTFIPLSKTYLNGGRYDDDMPRPPRSVASMVVERERPHEEDPYMRSVNRVALPWLMRKGGLPAERMNTFRALLQTLAQDARELHQRGELTDKYAQTIRDELTDFASRDSAPF